jgi:hypothetical protein
MRVNAYSGVLLAFLYAEISPSAQTSQPGTGTVTGHVICQDTQKPARFGNVLLYEVPKSITPAVNFEGLDPLAVDVAMKAQMEAVNSVTVVQAETMIDGSFAAPNVPPGDYYALAAIPGYVQPRNLVQAAYDAGEDLTKGLTGAPIVHVSADRSAQAEITAIRGAAVEGHVLWDDGGPVGGAVVTIEPTAKEHKPLPPQFGNIMGASTYPLTPGVTDDRGHYRVSGLAPGEYRVKATLLTNSHMTFSGGKLTALTQAGTFPVNVYAPGAFHQADAKPVKLASGEERADQDITYNLNGLHMVSGTVTSAEDHHPLNSGSVALVDAMDKTFRRSAGIDAQGNFSVTFVPAGTYTMTVSNAADMLRAETKSGGPISFDQVKILRGYEKAERKVIVADSDVTGQNFDLKPQKAGQADNSSGGP